MINSFVRPKWGIAYIVLPFFDTEIVHFVGVGERRSDSCTEFDDCFAFCFFYKEKVSNIVQANLPFRDLSFDLIFCSGKFLCD